MQLSCKNQPFSLWCAKWFSKILMLLFTYPMVPLCLTTFWVILDFWKPFSEIAEFSHLHPYLSHTLFPLSCTNVVCYSCYCWGAVWTHGEPEFTLGFPLCVDLNSHAHIPITEVFQSFSSSTDPSHNLSPLCQFLPLSAIRWSFYFLGRFHLFWNVL